MPSKADQLEATYGDEVRQLALIHTTARRLKGALEERRPPLYYTDGVLKQWLQKYGSGSSHATLRTNATLSAKELQEQYGEILQEEARESPTAYKLQKALARRSPSLHVSEAALKQWFAKYHKSEQYVKVITAARLELEYGAKIRGCSFPSEPKEHTFWPRMSF